MTGNNKKKQVIAYPHIHFDREWYREFEEFRLRLVEIFDVIFDEFDKKELKAFFFDGQTSSIEDYLELHPEKEERIKKLIKEKKLFLGPFYCLSDVFLVSAECLIRNLIFGISKSKELGCNDFFAYLADTFGHSKAIPSILKAFNIDKTAIWRGVGDTPSEFLWRDIKTTNLLRGYFQDVFSYDTDYSKKAELLKDTLDKIAKNSGNTLLLPIGGDHLCVPKNLETQVKNINKLLKDYEIKIGTPFDYFKVVINNYKKKYNDEFLDNSKTFILPGIYSSRTYLKQQNKFSEYLLTDMAEPLNAFNAFVFNLKSYQKELDYAYKELIKNHAHDGIYGCSIDNVHSEMETRNKKVNQVSEGVIKRCLRNLSNNKNDGFSVINLSQYSFSNAVKITTDKKLPDFYNAQLINSYKFFTDEKLYNIDEVPITEDIKTIKEYLVDVKNIPQFSVKTIEKQNINLISNLKITDKSIENDNILLKVNNGKIYIKDKKNNKSYNNAFTFIDRKDVGDSYNFAPLKGDKIKYSKIIDSKILVKGHILSVLRIFYELDKQKFYLDVKLKNQSENLEFEIFYNNKKKNHLLQMEFNTEENIEEVISEDTLGLIKRKFDYNYKIEDYIPAPRGIELKTNTRPFQRFLSVQDYGIITKGLQEYEVYKNKLRLTLLRTTGIISNPKNPSRGTPAGPPIEVEGLQCIGKNIYKLSLICNKEPQELYKTTCEFYNKVLTVNSKLNDKNLFEIKNKNIIVQTIKYNEQSKTAVIRGFNISNVKQKLKIKSDFNIFKSDVFENKKEKISENYEIMPNELFTVLLKN